MLCLKCSAVSQVLQVSPHPSSESRDCLCPLGGIDGTGSEVIKEDNSGPSLQIAARDWNH